MTPPSDLSRRKFIATSASASAFTIVSPQAVRGSQANSKISVGLIGSGNRGSYDASIVNADPRAAVTALCDLYDDQFERAKKTIKVENPALFKDYEKLLASNVDAVIIGTPPFRHPEHLEAAVQAKKHVYCEKPMGVDKQGCLRSLKASRKQDPAKNLFVGFQQRYGPVYLEAYKRFKDGAIGELGTARGFWLAGDPFKRKDYDDAQTARLRNWFSYKDYSGDIIVEQDCHNLDVFHWFLGLPTSAVGYGGTKLRTSMDIMDHLSLSFWFPNNIQVAYEANQTSPPGISHVGEEFTGTKGQLDTSRQRLVHRKSASDIETIPSKRDITVDAFDTFLGNIESGKVENIGERSVWSTLIAILGRTAIYEKREATWKGEFSGIA